VCFAGGSKVLSTNASKKAEEAVKSGRLVVTGQLLQMLTNTQRPRTAASSAGIDKTKKGPLSWKLHDVAVKGVTGSGASKPKTEPTANMPELQGESGVVTENVQLKCASEDEMAMLDTGDTADTSLTVNAATSADTFCPKITSIVSLEKSQRQGETGF